jgi:hypothetical protein
MVSHQNQSLNIEGRFGFVFGEVGFEIPFCQEYSLVLVSSGNYMAEGAGKMNPWSSSHALFEPQPRNPINTLLQLGDPILHRSSQSLLVGRH